MVNSHCIDINTVTQLSPSIAITVNRTSVVTSDTVIVPTGN